MEKKTGTARKVEEPKAEEPKAEEPKAEEPKAEEPKAEEPKAKVKPGHKAGYMATKRPMRHAYVQSVVFPVTGEPVKVAEEDNWLECQINAGLIRRM